MLTIDTFKGFTDRSPMPDNLERMAMLIRSDSSLQVSTRDYRLALAAGHDAKAREVKGSVLCFAVAVRFNGGKAVLEGVWGHSKAHGLVEKMLRGAGLNVKYGSSETVCTGKERETAVPAAEVMAEVVASCPELLPLASVIMAAAVHEGASVTLPELSEEDSHLVTAFLVRCGVEEKEGKLSSSETVIPGTWVAPSAQWAMAYALCAFLRPNLHLSNPGVMTSLFPPFWNMYNTLPVPVLKRKLEKEDEDAKPARRRVIARGVYGELPPEPAAGEDF